MVCLRRLTVEPTLTRWIRSDRILFWLVVAKESDFILSGRGRCGAVGRRWSRSGFAGTLCRRAGRRTFTSRIPSVRLTTNCSSKLVMGYIFLWLQQRHNAAGWCLWLNGSRWRQVARLSGWDDGQEEHCMLLPLPGYWICEGKEWDMCPAIGLKHGAMFMA